MGETGGERYLTDVFPLIRERGGRIAAHTTADVSSAMGVNTRADLAAVQEIAQRRVVDALAASGVTFESPGDRGDRRRASRSRPTPRSRTA